MRFLSGCLLILMCLGALPVYASTLNSSQRCGFRLADSKQGASLIMANQATFRFQNQRTGVEEGQDRGPLGVSINGYLKDQSYEYSSPLSQGVIEARAYLDDELLAAAYRLQDGRSIVFNLQPGAEAVAFLDRNNQLINCRSGSARDVSVIEQEIRREGIRTEKIAARVFSDSAILGQLGFR